MVQQTPPIGSGHTFILAWALQRTKPDTERFQTPVTSLSHINNVWYIRYGRQPPQKRFATPSKTAVSGHKRVDVPTKATAKLVYVPNGPNQHAPAAVHQEQDFVKLCPRHVGVELPAGMSHNRHVLEVSLHKRALLMLSMRSKAVAPEPWRTGR